MKKLRNLVQLNQKIFSNRFLSLGKLTKQRKCNDNIYSIK